MPQLPRQLLLVIVGLVLSVAGTTQVTAADLLVAPDEAPQYRLKNLDRDIDRFNRIVIIFEYERVKKGEGAWANSRIDFAGKTKSSSLTAFQPLRLDPSGELKFVFNGGLFGGSRDLEIYFVMRGASGAQYLVSNTLRKGNPGSVTQARPWTEEEKRQEARAKLRKTPPNGLPEGHVAATVATTLVPGMPVKTGYYGEWVDAEVINFDVAGPVRLKISQEDRLQEHPREKWIAVHPDILARAKANPSDFKPSVQALSGSKLIIPDGAVALDDDLELPEGTPLLYDYGHTWKEVFVLSTASGDEKIGFRYKGYGSNWDEVKPKEKFLITLATKKLLGDPDSVKKFAKNVAGEERGGSWPDGKTISSGRSGTSRIKSYPVRIPVPKKAQFVPEDLGIEEGTPLAACWARKWCPITAIRENEDGSIYVGWDGYADSWNCNMSRDELIIQDKTVRKLRRKQQASGDLAKTLRTWTDVTGKHKIEARFVEQTKTKVTLKTDTGREITLSVAKLCEEDRELLSRQATEGENPFE